MKLKLIIKNMFHIKRTTTFWWVSIVILSIAWYPLTGIYLPANYYYSSPVWFGIAALVFAFIFSTAAPDVIMLQLNSTASSILLFSIIFFIILIPFPYNVSGFFLLIGVISLVFTTRSGFKKLSKFLKHISSSAFICGMILLVQTAVFPVFYLFASRFHRVDLVVPELNFLLKIFGASVANYNGNIFIQYSDRVYSFIPSLELTGLYPLLNVFIGGCVLLYFLSAPMRKYFKLIFIILIYMIFHFILVTFAFIEVQRASVFWRLDFLLLSLMPLPWILNKFTTLSFMNSPLNANFNFMRISKGSNQAEKEGLKSNTKRKIAYIISLSLLLISSAGFFGFDDPGIKKEGRILIDEGHSDWEWTTEKFNTTWYGEQSTYNYWSLAQYLNYYYKVDKKREELTDKLLNNYDILFIKTPTGPFTQSEIESIKRFVANGGGLFLIGDHTNVFGITTNLNPLASQFGMEFKYDCQYDITGELSLYKRPVILPHPVVQYMPEFMFATSCMLDAPLTAENVIIGYGIKSIYADYSQTNFFPKDAGNSEKMKFGLFVQAAGMPFGKGRVFLFSDSTVWSNFYMFIPGKPELLLGIIDWLNRRNSVFMFLHLAFLLIAFVSLIATILLGRKIGKGNLTVLTVVVGLITAPTAIHSFEQLNRFFHPVPKEHTNYTEVNFESEHSGIELPVLHIPQNMDKSYHTFYVWLQRINIVPKLYTSYSKALNGSNTLVIINPVKPFTLEEVQRTKEFVENGGKLLLIDDPSKTDLSVSNKFLSSLGVPVNIKNDPQSPITIFRNKKDTLHIETSTGGEIKGGKQLLYCQAENFPQLNASGKFQQYSNVVYAGKKYNILPGKAYHLPNSLMRKRLREDAQINKIIKTQNEKNHNYNGSRIISNPDTLTTRPVMSEISIGKGKVIVLAASSLFTDREMGFTTVFPNENQLMIYGLEYWIFRDVLDLK
ncbi:MAG: DUF4350 domain-containing protein [Ignavibacteriaceae bacterium]